MKNIFIGIDFSKKTFDATVLKANLLHEKGEHRQFSNNKNGALKLIKWVEKIGAREECLFCGEDTGLYSKIVSETIVNEGCFMWLDSALRIKRSLGISREKNDKKDSRDIALYAARFNDRAECYVPLDQATEALKKIFTMRKQLMKIYDKLLVNYYESKRYLDNELLSNAFAVQEELISQVKEKIKELEKQIKKIIESSPKLNKTFEILTSMPGIALINATAFIVYTNNFKKFNYDARKIASFWGVAPFGHTSGTSIKGTPHVSHYADSYLKSLLSEAALCASRYCPIINRYVNKLKKAGKHKNIVLNNAKNKMIHILVAMVRNNENYRKAV